MVKKRIIVLFFIICLFLIFNISTYAESVNCSYSGVYQIGGNTSTVNNITFPYVGLSSTSINDNFTLNISIPARQYEKYNTYTFDFSFSFGSNVLIYPDLSSFQNNFEKVNYEKTDGKSAKLLITCYANTNFNKALNLSVSMPSGGTTGTNWSIMYIESSVLNLGYDITENTFNKASLENQEKIISGQNETNSRLSDIQSNQENALDSEVDYIENSKPENSEPEELSVDDTQGKSFLNNLKNILINNNVGTGITLPEGRVGETVYWEETPVDFSEMINNDYFPLVKAGITVVVGVAFVFWLYRKIQQWKDIVLGNEVTVHNE